MTGLKVLAYNVWGMPRQVGGQNKSVRIPAIASLLKERKEEFDIILLSELWYEADHGIIKEAMVRKYKQNQQICIYVYEDKYNNFLRTRRGCS